MYWQGSKARPRRPVTPRPAPGDLALAQAFVNTTAPESGDELASPAGLGDWLYRHELLGDGIELDADDLQRARDVRGGLRTLLFANSGGKVDADAVRRMERAARGARSEVRFDDGGPAGFRSAARHLDDALGVLLAAVAAARLAGLWPQLRLCARDGCRRAFFDGPDSRNRKWCTKRCGHRVRAAAYRKRPLYHKPRG